MIGAYAVAWALIQALSPLLVLGLGIYDLVSRNRAASLRLLGMLWVFLTAELLGVFLSGVVWLRHVLTPGREHDAFLEDNHRLQRWWAHLLLRSGARLMQLRFTVEGDTEAVPGPVILLMQHTSLADTLLPVVLLGARHGVRLRYVLKKELLIDPCLDIVGNRLPNYFVDRSGVTEGEVEAVGRLAEDLGERDAVLIYPEGTRFTPAKLERARARLAERDPELSEMASSFQNVLPPRPGGALALLDRALPGADVVVLTHRGLERLVHIHDILSGKVLGSEVHVRMQRVPGAEIPPGRKERIQWLFDQWKQVDAWAGEPSPLTTTARPPSTRPLPPGSMR